MTKSDAIYSLYPQVVLIRGDDAFDADGNQVQYDNAQVNSLVAANEYKKQRANEYPSIVDQLDILYHTGFDGWKAAIKAVKDKYPKEGI